MADQAIAPSGAKLFVRQSSGLVREVSVLNALFYNTAAFIGVGVVWYPVFFALALVPVGITGPFSSYAWAAVICGAFAVLLSLIFASLATVMPRSGGDYVFTSRFIPRAGPFLAWLEAFMLCWASLAVIAFEIPIVLRNLQIDGLIIGIGTRSSFFVKADNWFASNGSITGWPGFLWSLAVLAVVVLIVVQPTRRMHRIITWFAVFGVASAALLLFIGTPFMSQSRLVANLPKYTGFTAAQISAASVKYGVHGTTVDFAPKFFSFFLFVILFQYIGFQYSAYIAGEVRGKITRTIMVAVLGALGMGIFLNAIYTDVLAHRLGFNLQVGWGALFWNGGNLPLGQPNATPLLAALSRPGGWPFWLIINFFGGIMPLVLIPVYINFMSRIMLAWGLDRQVPEWFCRINERVRAPLNAILVLIGISAVLVIFENFSLLPSSVATGGKLNLAGSAWFSGLCALLAWLMPGVNAIVAPITRPDLLRSAPWRRWLPLMGVIWLIFGGVLYWYAGVVPIYDTVKSLTSAHSSVVTYLNTSGVTFMIGVAVLAVILYLIQWTRNRRAGVELRLLYHEIPPD